METDEEVQLLPDLHPNQTTNTKITVNNEELFSKIDDENYVEIIENNDNASLLNENDKVNVNTARRSDEPTELSFEKCKSFLYGICIIRANYGGRLGRIYWIGPVLFPLWNMRNLALIKYYFNKTE